MMIRNFGVVEPKRLYRSGRYTFKGMSEVAKAYGFRRIVCLRESQPLFGLKTYRKAGFDFVHLRLIEHQRIDKSILDVVFPAGIQSTLVHCWKGAHRTGAVIGLLRRRQGWDDQSIWEEMSFYGFGKPENHLELYLSVFPDKADQERIGV